MRRALFAALALCTPVALSAPVRAAAQPVCSAPQRAINLSGFQSALQPARGADRLGQEYVLPSDATLAYFKARGFTTIRLPMLWERMQPRVGGPLNTGKVAELRAFLDRADHAGMRVIADLHAFARRDIGGHESVLGSSDLPIEALPAFWGPFAAAFRGRLAGYDIMNEPHDMPSPQVWPRAAQASVDAIRGQDRTTPIYIEGDNWSNADFWASSNAGLAVQDPAGRIVYSAHLYFDADHSGQYRKPYAQDGATPEIGAHRLAPFVGWLRQHHLRGQIGEMGVPHDDAGWLPVLDRFLDAARRSCDVLEGTAYWMAGDWADRYALTLQPVADGRWADRPQMPVLMRPRP